MNKLINFAANGQRLTKQRSAILSILQNKPLTIHQMKQCLENKKFKVHLATLYRTMETLESMGFVHSIVFNDGIKYYEYKNENKHHHHFVCNTCGDIEDVVIKNEQDLIRPFVRKNKVVITSHTMEFSGVCSKCQ